MRSAHDSYIRDVIGASLLEGGNQKRLWSYVKLNKTENMSVPILSDREGLHITDQAKSEALSRQFVSVFTQVDGKEPPDKGPSPYGEMDHIHFTHTWHIEKLLSINPTKAAGPDELPSKVLKEVGREIAGALAFVFQQSYEEGAIPKDWSTARISAIYKKGDKDTPANYRPVSLTCIICKIMEHVVCSQIGRHLDDYNILYPHQHSFRKQLSCETQLISSINDWASSINMKRQTDVIMLDFSKPFDKVSHTKLLHKIRHYGITSNTNNWIKADVLSGVPQGTVLGPMLFLLYINDIHEGVHSKMRLFADDSIVHREILTPQDHISLNNDVDTLHQWATMWQMDFNVTKCVVLSITTKKKTSIHDYVMNGEKIPRTDNT